jgi:glutamate 5-kinase
VGDHDGAKLLVLKVGTSTLMASSQSGAQKVNLTNIAQLVELISGLRLKGYQVVLVSSGAVGMGCIKLGIDKPKDLRKKQAVAAAGQSQLMRLYEDLFTTVGLHVAQLLINQGDFLDKEHWSNIRHTIHQCLALNLVPVINENDCTNTTELRFGDNDNLAALTAVQLEADGLFLFTDVDYLYTANPRTDPTAKALRLIPKPWSLQVDTTGAGSGAGTGGMSTKITAARMATAAGIACGMINGAHSGRLHKMLDFIFSGANQGDSVEEPPEGTYEGTFFMPMRQLQTVGDTRRWIMSLPVAGDLVLDDGAARALSHKKSLLPAGILSVKGVFQVNECVKLVHRDLEIARAVVTLSSDELTKIRGQSSTKFEEILGYCVKTEACHRDNIIITVTPEVLQQFDVLGKMENSSFQPRMRKDKSGASIASEESS